MYVITNQNEGCFHSGPKQQIKRIKTLKQRDTISNTDTERVTRSIIRFWPI